MFLVNFFKGSRLTASFWSDHRSDVTAVINKLGTHYKFQIIEYPHFINNREFENETKSCTDIVC